MRDDLQNFFDEAPPKIDRDVKGMTQDEIMALASSDCHIPKLRWGYQRLFLRRTQEIFWEFGERNCTPMKLGAAMDSSAQVDDFYKELIKVLTEIAEMPQAAN